MSSAYGPMALMATKHSQLAGALLGSRSLWQPAGYNALAPFHADDLARTSSSDGATPTFGGSVRYPLIKNSTLIGQCIWKCTISAGTLSGGRRAAYVKNLGDQMIQEVTLRYGGNILQSIPNNVWAPLWRRLCKHDAHIEGTNAMVLGGLPAGNAAAEGVREAAVTSGLDIYVPLEELFFAHSRDEHWMPEAHALEAEIILQLAPLGRLVYSDNGADPFSARPTLSADELRYREITLTAAEKETRLNVYMQEQGHVIKFLDIERQENVSFVGTGTGNNRTLTIPLDNFRMDLAEIAFLMRDDANTAAGVTPAVSADWRGDAMESSTAASIITGAAVNCVNPIVSFDLRANGRIIYQSQEEFYNRAVVRSRYHPDSQIADAFYTIPFAEFPEDYKNATGHQSAQVLGKLELRVVVADWASTITRRFDVYGHSHNFIQVSIQIFFFCFCVAYHLFYSHAPEESQKHYIKTKNLNFIINNKCHFFFENEL